MEYFGQISWNFSFVGISFHGQEISLCQIFFPHYVQSKLFANVFIISCEFNMHVACTQNPNPCTTYMRTIKHEVHMPILIINIFIMGFTTIFPTNFFLFFNQNIGKFLKVFFSYWKFLYFFPSNFEKIRKIFDIKNLKKKTPKNGRNH
jgi:hypothetical protein